MDEKAYWHEYELTRNDVHIAIESFYTNQEVNNCAAENPSIYDAINKESSFWIIQQYGLQIAFFLALGRIFDTDRRSHTIDKFLSTTVAHPEFFSKDALAARKQGGGPKPDWLDHFLIGVCEPSAAELSVFQTALEPWKSRFETVYKPIRNKVFAHRALTHPGQGDALFSNTQIKEVDELLYSLWDIMESIWQLYHNGTKPTIGKRTYDHRERIKKSTFSVLSGLIRNAP